MNYYIVTGTSRGLGEAIIEQLLQEGNFLFCISRNKNEKLIEQAMKLNIGMTYFPFDLSQVNQIDGLMESIFSYIDKANVESLTLINNAGIVAPIKPIELCTSEEIITSTLVNMTAPMVLTSNFISRASEIKADKQIVNISSGAGKKPYYGWSNYCSSKAGIDLFTRCVGLEQADKAYPVRVLSFAPGTVDTDMQQEIRKSNKEDFHDIERFISLKEEGKLLTPEFVAKFLIDLLENKDVGNGEMLDIRQFI